MERETARDVSSGERKKLAKKGKAMGGGSFPIANVGDLRNAIQAYGRASNKAAAKRHIIKRARALGRTDLLPAGWLGKEKSMEPYFDTRDRLRSWLGRDDDFGRQRSLMEREMPEAEPQPVTYVEVPRARAFMYETDHSTILTAPAGLIREASARQEPYIYLQGRFVGAERANRNGALWALEDLEFGEPSVKHGPVNWLHDERKVVGAITDSELVMPESEREAAAYGAPYADPFISANSVLWRFLYPQEAAVVEMASERKSLWYSMECVSESVVCSGDNGCGAEMSYADALLKTAQACEHVRERASERRFKNPIFLGGAIVVPPVRPGWADANASLMRTSAALAEKAYEQAGRPEMDDQDWHTLCAQVLDFAG